MANKIHPILGFSKYSRSYFKSHWDIDFENPVADVFKGKLPTEFFCCGEFDGGLISVDLQQYAVKYPECSQDDTNDDATIENNSVTLKCYTFNYREKQWVGQDINFEYCPLKSRLSKIPEKSIRGFGNSSILIDGVEVEGSYVEDPNVGRSIRYIYNASEFQESPLPSVLSYLNYTGVQIYLFDDNEMGEPYSIKPSYDDAHDTLKRYFLHHDPKELTNAMAFRSLVNKYLYNDNPCELETLLFKKYGGKKISEFWEEKNVKLNTIKGKQCYFKNSLNPLDLYEGKIPDSDYVSQSVDPVNYTLVTGKSEDFNLPPSCSNFSSLIAIRDPQYGSIMDTVIIDAGSVEMRNELLQCLAPIHMRQLTEDLSDPIKCGDINSCDIHTLFEHTKPSHFGLGDEKIYDEAVRKGRELLPHQVGLDVGDLQEQLTAIKNKLFPESSEIRLKFSKMAFYDSGGHFDVHRDTVHNKYHQGTLLVEVVSLHTGGDLVLEMNGEKYRWELQNRDPQFQLNVKSKNEEEDEKENDDNEGGEEEDEDDASGNEVEEKKNIKNVKFIAFYTDVVHSVEPVTSGMRAVIQFDIYALYENAIKDDDSDIEKIPEEEEVHLKITQETIDEDEDEKKKDEDVNKNFFENVENFDSDKVNSAMTSKIVSLLDSSVTDNKGIAFPLLHLYTNTQVLVETLKQGDRQIFQACLDAGYCVQMVPIIIDAYSSTLGKYDESAEYYVSAIPSVLTDSEVGYVLDDDGEVMTVDIKLGKTYPRITYAATGFEQVEMLNSKPAQRWAGNEPAPAEHKYFTVACVVTTKNILLASCDDEEEEEEDDNFEEGDEEAEENDGGEDEEAEENDGGEDGNVEEEEQDEAEDNEEVEVKEDAEEEEQDMSMVDAEASKQLELLHPRKVSRLH